MAGPATLSLGFVASYEASVWLARDASGDTFLFDVKKAYSNRFNRKWKPLNSKIKGYHLTSVVRIFLQRRFE